MGVKKKDRIRSGPGVKFQICKGQNRDSLRATNHLNLQISETGLGHGKEGRGLIFLDKLF